MRWAQKKFSGVVALFAILALVFAACGDGNGTQTDDTGGQPTSGETDTGDGGDEASGLPESIRIGVPLDTSGSAAIAGVGNAELAGVELAAKEINESGFLGETQLELVVRDTKAEQQEAVSTTTELIERENVDAIVGYTLSPSFFAAGPLTEEAGMPVVTVGLSAVGVTDVGENVFRIYPDLTRLFGSTDPEFLEAVGAETVAFLYGNDTETTVGQYEFRQDLVDELGLETATVQTVTAEDTDVRAQVTEIANANPDAWFLNVNTGQQPGILLQAEEQGLLPGGTQIIGDVGFGNATVLEQAGDALQCGLFATTWTVDAEAGQNPHFVELYRSEHDGEDPDAFVAWGYDAIWMAATAFKDAGSTDSEAVIEALNSVEGFDGALGTYGFDEERQPTQDGFMMQVQDGEPVLWTPDTTCER